MTLSTVLGVDVGGTSIKARLVGVDGEVLGGWREPTPRDDPSGFATIATIAGLIEDASAIAAVGAVGLVVPGIVDEDLGVVIAAVNLGWVELPIAALARAAFGIPVAFGQDVRAGALAESVSGAASGIDGTVAFIPVGTGLAAAFIVDGEPLVSGGWAGEIGQIVIAEGPFAGHRVEEIASASGVARRAGVASALEAATLVRDGDVRATTAWQDTINVLADSLAGICSTIAPTTIVIGGGLAESGALLFDPLEKALVARLGLARRPRLVAATHGEAAGVIGAVYLAQRMLGSRP
ncbi:ROK family protein [Glaciihabitans sp. dw_435]|uniref:ROK family protein n=1 Tax=Glaciihabitans sp. dw_435 TaxID=2720081 RepID=UPI001BD31C80|nr:ROK family protein [Glaciihabitans sp. dw_435]